MPSHTANSVADGIAPVASSSIDYRRSHITEAPRTEFPYPEPISSSALRVDGREGSDATLNNSPTVGTSDEARQGEPSLQRPNLASRKYETEVSKPVALRPVIPPNHRKSTSGQPDGDGALTQDVDWSTSDTDSSTEEDEPVVDLNRQQSLPQRDDLRARELNRARMRPWHENKRQKVSVGNDYFHGRGRIARDGRLNVKISEVANTGYLAKALGNAISSHLHPQAQEAKEDALDLRQRHHIDPTTSRKIPPMNIVIMVIGSRGDIQPFLKIGQILRDKYGHRVRIATHPAFRKFVQDEIGLEFFSIGGDPSELMAFMVKNPGLIPSFETLTSGEVGRRREQMFEMFNGFWRACINATDDEKDTANLKLLGNKFPFVADAIIGNPPSFAHYHCAERLGIPLQLVFTFPYTPTAAFPHPLANIKASNVDRDYTNYMSYPLVDLMTWQGLGDLINRFRVKTLGLDPVSTLWAPGQLTRMRVPMTYLWSPGLVPKPEDWGEEVSVAGYVFLDLAKSYKPPDDLVQFLKRSESDSRPLIYVGFGSISGIDDPKAFCKLIFDATVEAGVRAVISRGWGGMGDGVDKPESVFLVDNVPHDWLFPQVDAVVHHGGAGTCAIGLKLGKPTMIVPFFGDQPFWAQMVVKAGAGAKKVWPLKKLTVDRFAESIRDCLEPSAKENAQAIAKSIALEGDGAENAVNLFHQALNLDGKHSMRCGVFEDRLAVWSLPHTKLKLSALAADLLVENKQITWDDLDLIRHKKWVDFSGPGEPLTGAGGAVVGAFQEAFHGMSSIHENTKADLKRIERHRRRKKRRTVADAVIMPGKMAQHIRGPLKTESNDEVDMAKINLTGEAEPVRKPTLAGLVSDDDSNRRNPVTRTDTTSTLRDPPPILLAKDVGSGLGHSFRAIALLPADMLNAVTLGFRNAPRLYGDRTVRPPPQNIHGLRQGARVAGKEFWFGISDGTTGLVRIPYLDVAEDGISGLPKGVARGMGGLVLKPIAGTLGLLNYTNKGLYATIRRRIRDTTKTERWIRRARIAQGAIDIKELREREKAPQQANGHSLQNSGPQDELEKARTTALTRFTSRDRDDFQQAREKEKRLSLLPSNSSKSQQV